MDLELQGRRAIATGAATRFGKSTVEALSAEGVTVAAIDL